MCTTNKSVIRQGDITDFNDVKIKNYEKLLNKIRILIYDDL